MSINNLTETLNKLAEIIPATIELDFKTALGKDEKIQELINALDHTQTASMIVSQSKIPSVFADLHYHLQLQTANADGSASTTHDLHHQSNSAILNAVLDFAGVDVKALNSELTEKTVNLDGNEYKSCEMLEAVSLLKHFGNDINLHELHKLLNSNTKKHQETFPLFYSKKTQDEGINYLHQLQCLSQAYVEPSPLAKTIMLGPNQHHEIQSILYALVNAKLDPSLHCINLPDPMITYTKNTDGSYQLTVSATINQLHIVKDGNVSNEMMGSNSKDAPLLKVSMGLDFSPDAAAITLTNCSIQASKEMLSTKMLVTQPEPNADVSLRPGLSR